MWPWNDQKTKAPETCNLSVYVLFVHVAFRLDLIWCLSKTCGETEYRLVYHMQTTQTFFGRRSRQIENIMSVDTFSARTKSHQRHDTIIQPIYHITCVTFIRARLPIHRSCRYFDTSSTCSCHFLARIYSVGAERDTFTNHTKKERETDQ